MPRVFLLLSVGGPTGAETQARLALAELPQVEFETAISHVGHAFDFPALRALRDRIATDRSDVLHAVGSNAARAAMLLRLPLVGLKPFPRLILSGCDAPDGWLTRRAVARADAVLAYSSGEEQRYRQFVRPEQIRLVPPGVVIPDAGGPNPDPSQGRLAETVVAVGNFDRWSGLKTAVWAFDLLKYLSPDFHLLLIGDGPGRAGVDRFGRALGFDDYRVRFAGLRTDVPARLAASRVAWVTHERGGVSVCLEAMAAGTPVVAVRTADTESVVADGETGVLVPVGDRAALATATAALLGRPDDLRRLADAGRRQAERFSPRALAEGTAAAYDART